MGMHKVEKMLSANISIIAIMKKANQLLTLDKGMLA